MLEVSHTNDYWRIMLHLQFSWKSLKTLNMFWMSIWKWALQKMPSNYLRQFDAQCISKQLNATQYNSMCFKATQRNSMTFNVTQKNSLQLKANQSDSKRLNMTWSNSTQFKEIQQDSIQLNATQKNLTGLKATQLDSKQDWKCISVHDRENWLELK